MQINLEIRPCENSHVCKLLANVNIFEFLRKKLLRVKEKFQDYADFCNIHMLLLTLFFPFLEHFGSSKEVIKQPMNKKIKPPQNTYGMTVETATDSQIYKAHHMKQGRISQFLQPNIKNEHHKRYKESPKYIGLVHVIFENITGWFFSSYY